MSSIIKNLGLALIIIGAAILFIGYFLGWVNNNAISILAMVAMIGGFITYIIAGKKSMEKN